MGTTVATAAAGRPSTRRFLRHGFAMLVAMVLGMAAYVAVVGALYGDVEEARVAQPELYALGMAAAMSIPMVVWMRRRGHDWAVCNEMVTAMALPYAVFILCYWVGGLSAASICPLSCALMLPAMAAAMLYRVDEYA